MVHKNGPREGATIGDIVRAHPEFQLVDQRDACITRGSSTRYITLLHHCKPGEHRQFTIRADHFANGHLCTHCGPNSKSMCGDQTCSPCTERSLFHHKEAIWDHGVRMCLSDNALRKISASSNHRMVPCECLTNASHPPWLAVPYKLSARGDGCNQCGYMRSAAAKAMPASFDKSLAAILDRLAARIRGVAFLRLRDPADTRGPEDICMSSGKYAVWLCMCCANEWEATIGNVVRTSSCPLCCGLSDTERTVVEYLRTVSHIVIRQPRVGKYYMDAAVSHCGKWIAVEVDGTQHYTPCRFFSKLSLEEQISRDVEKMRCMASGGVPTIRVPTVAVSKHAGQGEEWKGMVRGLLDAAARWTDDQFPMFVAREHTSKYQQHVNMLRP